MSKKVIKCFMSAVICTGLTLLCCVIPAAADKTETVSGNIYDLDANSNYEFDQSEDPLSSVKAGSLTVSGDIVEKTAGDVAQYAVKEGLISLTYTPNGTYQSDDAKEWHFVDDNSQNINGVTLSDSIKKGAVVVETSFDRNKWVTVSSITNIFADETLLASPFYTSNDIQLSNGCYYRVTVAYMIAIGSESSEWYEVWDTNSYKKCAEVYEFYAAYPKVENSTHNEKKFSLGSKVYAGHDSGFSQKGEIKVDDLHYGWDLGNFFVSGYTEKNEDLNGEPIFLKNLGDKVTLTFNLAQDIDRLNNQDDLKVNGDANGYDQYFETPKTDFGRGTLIIRYTDHEGIKHDPVIYTNYLEALSSPGADTVVRMFEEGDYEVALDYELIRSTIVPEYKDYRISFNFKIRNGNCMVYPFDATTKAELTDSSVTQNGFYLDLARSRYLKIIVIRSVWTKGATGYTEDVRFNRPAKDGEQYTDEGIYTIEVSNPSTGKETTKTIYVGTDNVLLAYMNPANAKYGDINSISKKLDNGEITINDGIIYEIAAPTLNETDPKSAEKQTVSTQTTGNESDSVDKPDSSNSGNILVIVLAVAAGVIIVSVIAAVLTKKKKADTNGKNGVK